MPKITLISVQTKNKNRCNLFVDGQFYAGVSVESVITNRLKVGQEIDRENLSRVIFETERSDALKKATEYVSKSLKTKKQVKDYLTRKGYSEDIIFYCIDKLKGYDYINDVEYSKRYISSQNKTNGKRLLEYKLMAKGVNKQDVSSAFGDCEIDGKLNAKLVAEKYIKNKERSIEVKAKTYRYLISRGFSYDEANFAVSELFNED